MASITEGLSLAYKLVDKTSFSIVIVLNKALISATIIMHDSLRWLARKLSSSDHRTLLPKSLIFFFFPSSSPLVVYSYLTIYNVNIL